MEITGLQRTLLIGLGEIGAQTADSLLAALKHRLGDIGILQGVAMPAREISLNHIAAPLVVTGGVLPESWQPDFQQQIDRALRDISQLEHLAGLRQQGVHLRHADEIHGLFIANPAEPWIAGALPQIIQYVRGQISHILSCHASFTGVWLFVPPALEAMAETGPAPTSPADGDTGQDFRVELSALPLADFDRGCFVAGLTNEVGLIVGDVDRLVQRTVTFLTLLVHETAIVGLHWDDEAPAGWGIRLTSFGLATIRWPGRELARVLGKRWARSWLHQLVAPPVEAGLLVEKAQAAARQLLNAQKLVPPLLIDQLSPVMPPLPNRLAALVPEVPWPWLWPNVEMNLEQAGQDWQEQWLAGRERLLAILAELETNALAGLAEWLSQVLAGRKTGVVMITHTYLAAMSETLRSFMAEMEHRLDEAQQDMAEMDDRIGRMTGALQETVRPFPASPVAMLLTWGRHPFRWPRYVDGCRQAHTLARSLAHLIRGRLLAWQTISYYEVLLPFYQRLLAGWNEIVVAWEQHCRQVTAAAHASELEEWAALLDRILSDAGDPWTGDLIDCLYDEAVTQQAEIMAAQIGDFTGWQAEALSAAEIVQRCLAAVNQSLAPLVALPVDAVLDRRFAGEGEWLDWLAEMQEQARPFWRFDETILAENSRAQIHQETWLLLPDAEISPLAHLEQIGSRPIRLVSTRNPEEMGVVMLRRWVATPGLDEDDEKIQ